MDVLESVGFEREAVHNYIEDIVPQVVMNQIVNDTGIYSLVSGDDLGVEWNVTCRFRQSFYEQDSSRKIICTQDKL